jgi:hypothetical protein
VDLASLRTLGLRLGSSNRVVLHYRINVVRGGRRRRRLLTPYRCCAITGLEMKNARFVVVFCFVFYVSVCLSVWF